MKHSETLIEFPCDFAIKVIGKNSPSFMAEILVIARQHFPDLGDSGVKCQFSQQGNFLSLTLTVYAIDKPSLDALYQDLTKHPDIQMVL